MSVGSILTVVGIGAGYALGLGPIGAAIGGYLGGAIGGAIDGPIHSSQAILEDLGALKLDYGSTWPRMYGRYRFKVSPLWSSTKRPIAHDTEVDAKGGPSAVNTAYTYEQDWLCWAPINAKGWARIWRNGELVASQLAESDSNTLSASLNTSAWASVTFFDGADDQMPWSVYEAAVGTENAVAYRHRPTLAFESLDLGQSGQPPLIEVEFYTDGTGDGQGFIESFNDGLDDWVFQGGLSSLLTIVDGPWGRALKFSGGPVTGDVTASVRSFNHTETDTISAKIRLDDLASSPVYTEDAPILQIRAAGGVPLVSFIPARETTVDISQRPHVSIGGGLTWAIGGGPLIVGAWYDFVAQITSPTTVTVTVRNSETGFLFGTATIPGSFTTWQAVDMIVFDQANLSGAGNFKPGASFDEIVVGHPGVTPNQVDLADIVKAEALLEWTGEAGPLTVADIDVSALVGTMVTGYATTGSPREAIAALADVYYFQAVCSDKLYFRFRGSASVATIPFADSGAGVGQSADPFCGLVRGNDLEVASQVAFTAPGLLRDYEPDTQNSDRLIGESFELRQYQSPVVFSPTEAKGRADTMVYDGRVAAHTGKLSLDDAYIALEPTDVVTATDDEGNTYLVRIERETFADGVREFDVVLDDPNVLLSSGITAETDQRAITIAPPASTDLILFDGPLLREEDDLPGHYAAVQGSGRWPGAVVYRADTETGTYGRIATVTTSAIAGGATTALGGWSGGNVFDETNTVRVEVTGGTLSSATRDDVIEDGSVNLFAIGEHGRWELVQVRDITLVSPGVYDWSGLLRGRLGTEHAMNSHMVGDVVVKLQASGMRSIDDTAGDIGVTRYWQAVTIGGSLAASGEAFTPESVRLMPLAPVDLRCSRDASGGFTITWARRSRYQADLFASLPLGEASEAYSIDVLDGDTVVRTLTATTTIVQYTPAQQVADFGSVQSSINVAVYQVSATVGRGYPLTGTLSTSYTPTGQVNTITLAGTFAAGVPISVYANGALVASRTSVSGDTNLNGVATGLAAAIDATSGYAASAVGSTITVTGTPGAAYTLTAIVGGTSSISVVKTQDAAVANDGTSFESQLFISNLSTGVTDPVDAGVTFTVTVKQNGVTVSSFNYTTTSSTSKVDALSGIIDAFGSNATLVGLEYSMSLGSTSGGDYYARFNGPVGAEGISLTTSGTSPWTLLGSVQREGSAPVAENQPQIVQATVTGTPANGEIYRVVLNGESFPYTATVPTDTREQVIDGLVALVDADADYSAVQLSGTKFEVTGAFIGEFTYSSSITRGITATVA